MLSSQLGPKLGAIGNGSRGEMVNETGSSSSRSPSKGRSLSDGDPPVLSPSPKFREPEKRTRDDTALPNPTTPRRPAFPLRGLSLQTNPNDLTTDRMPILSLYSSIPLSPKLDHSSTYGSPGSAIPRRSRGLDFSRAATNLHHSTLAEQPSPDASPTITGRAMNIPNRRSAQFGGNADSPNGNSTSLWSTMGSADRMNVSSSLGSVNMMGSETSSNSSEEDELMDADEIDDTMITTPQVHSTSTFGILQASPGTSWMTAPSPTVGSLMNFQRARLRNGKAPKHRKTRSASFLSSPISRSPPNVRSIESMTTGYGAPAPRRGSISWAANQLNISGSESDDGTLRSTLELGENPPSTPSRDGQRGIIKRAVTRRSNMLPKTKGFARIRAALLEEGAPVETEVRREADVIRLVREESDITLEPARPHTSHGSNTAQSSPMFEPSQADALDDIPEDDMMGDSSSTPSESQISNSFKQHVMKNSKGKEFWEGFVEEHRGTPPPFHPRGSSSGMSDTSMNSPAMSASGVGFLQSAIQFTSLDYSDPNAMNPPASPIHTTSEARSNSNGSLPTPAELTRKVNNKRRRDEVYDDLDPLSFKRRAVSPSMSSHGSPVMQSPMQRNMDPWGSRSGSNSAQGEKAIQLSSEGGLGMNTNCSTSGNSGGATGRVIQGTKRVGMQGMVDTNDGLMKMSID